MSKYGDLIHPWGRSLFASPSLFPWSVLSFSGWTIYRARIRRLRLSESNVRTHKSSCSYTKRTHRSVPPLFRHNNTSNIGVHPPFNNAAERFLEVGWVAYHCCTALTTLYHDQREVKDMPGYHVAYRDVMQPIRQHTKGWSALDDTVKGRRGTGAGKVFSSMAAATAPPVPGTHLQPMYATHPNESRLQELLDLQKRRIGRAPGPGQYEVPAFPPSKTCFRRQAIPQLDGPFLPEGGVPMVSTRVKEIDAVLRNPFDSGLGPGDYESHSSKDATMRQAPASKIGTGARECRTHHAKSVSISRAIQHGIDWHVPVVREEELMSEASSAVSVDAKPTRSGHNDQVPSRLLESRHEPPPAFAGKPPAPPNAVARSIRRNASAVPSEWDWAKLGHNYRNSWTTLHGRCDLRGRRREWILRGSVYLSRLGGMLIITIIIPLFLLPQGEPTLTATARR